MRMDSVGRNVYINHVDRSVTLHPPSGTYVCLHLCAVCMHVCILLYTCMCVCMCMNVHVYVQTFKGLTVIASSTK